MTQTNEKLPMKPNDDVLCHHGTKGQKWGIRRYQEKDGSLTPLGRIHWGIGPERKAAIKKKFTLAKDNVKKLALKAKTKHEENLKLRKEKQEQSIANKKAKLLSKGDPAEIHKNRALFSDAELDQAINRIKKLQDLKSMDPKQKEAMQKLQQTQQNRQVVKDGRSMTDKLISAGKTAVGLAGTAVAMYQVYNKIAGAINEISGKEQLPTYDLNPWSKKDTDKKNNDKDNSGNQNLSGQQKPKDNSGNQNQGGQQKPKDNSGNQNQGEPTNPATGNWNLKALGNMATTTSSITRKDGYQTTTKDTDLWKDISLSPSSWTSSSAVGDSSGSTASDAKLKRSSKKSQTIFDLDNGYLSKDDLKTIAKQEISKDQYKGGYLVAPLMSLYSGQEKAKDVSFKDLAADYTKTEYTGRTRTVAERDAWDASKSTGAGTNVTQWERTTTHIGPDTLTVGLGGISVSDKGSYAKKDWEDVGYDTSFIGRVNANRNDARVSFVDNIIKSGTTSLDSMQRDYANDIGLGQDYVNDLFDAMKGK